MYRRLAGGATDVLEQTYHERLRRGGIDFTFYTVGGDDEMFTGDADLLAGTLSSISMATREIEGADHFSLCRGASDISAAAASGQVGLMFTIEGVAPLRGHLEVLYTLHALGLRSATLTWFPANEAADGVGATQHGGLSPFGRDLVKAMNSLGVLIDVSQASPDTVDDVLEESRAPVVASHSNCAAVHPHRRNLTDEQLRGIATGGGVVGLTSFPAHVGDEDSSIEEYLDHVEHAVGVMGIDHVAIGLNIVVHPADEAVDFYERSGIEYTSLRLRGLEDIDRMPAIQTGLCSRGFGTPDVEKILGGNVIRVISQAVG